MKDLKFRVWKDGRMIYSDEYHMFYEFFEQACLDEDKAMMFTGVKDKNGKEIYEGDIVKYCRFISNGVEEWAQGNGIVFERGCFWTGNRRASGSFFENNRKDGDPALMYWQDSKWFEVIGNIYENKDKV